MLSKIKTNDPTDTNYVEDNSSSVKYMITDHMYGKNNVKILQLVRNGPIHSIKEFMVSTKLQLMSQKDYTHGNCHSFSMFIVLSLCFKTMKRPLKPSLTF